MKTHSEKWKQYVPFVLVENPDLPSVNELINTKERVFYRHKEVDASPRHQMSRGGTAQSDVRTIQSVADSVLDLGITPLQRIILEMRHLTTDTSDQHLNYNSSGRNELDLLKESKAVAELSGLMPYCDYIQGYTEPERIRKGYTNHYLRSMGEMEK